VFSKPLDDVFPLVAETGFDGIEIMVTKDPDTREPERLRGLVEETGVPIEAIHAPFLMMTRRVWGRDPIGKIDRAVELAEAVEAPLVVVHPPYRWQAAYRRWLRDELPSIADRTHVRVAVENMFPLRLRGRKVGAFHAIRTLEDLEGFGHVVLDTSHAAVAGLDLLDALERLGERLAHVHLSNNAGRGWDSHLPLDEGVLPIDAFLEALAASGYAGAISLEIDLRRHLDDPQALRRTLAASRERCAARLTLVG
jgi:sugar phosphate isomerase/epimerase